MNQQRARVIQEPKSVRVSLGSTKHAPRQVKTMQIAARSVPSFGIIGFLVNVERLRGKFQK